MPEQADYDTQIIQIDPETLGADARNLLELAEEMLHSVVRINETAVSLRLGWVAASADEAHAFGERWTRVMLQMFGDDGHPGVLPAMAGGALGAAAGFSQGELELEHMWQEFSGGMSAPAEGSPTPPSDRLGAEYPITQDFPDA
ncbi:hypothetical protein AB0G32_28085 [Streptomyces sp. NPDC023723]|uniref:hypothetical protein n=1 Tax=Streptomyces sp. NPDC023723 TaxID=3154323 RepID=UPI00340A939A